MFFTPHPKRRRLTLSFHTDEVFRLIEYVKRCPCLWDASYPKDNLRQIRREKWHEISQTKFRGKFDAEELQMKWDNMRIQFRQNHLRSTKTPGRPVNWRYYQRMLFLVDGTTGNEHENEEITHEENSTESAVKSEIFDEPEPSSSHGVSPATMEYDYGDYGDSQMGFEPRFSTSEVQDSFQVFGNFIASELRTIKNPRDANQIKRRLNYCLLECLDELDKRLGPQMTLPQTNTD